ncbi:signal recognition particle-docking protein FtsY [Halotalea alkalilenta]|uniref:signal recognition particle-docking protein FtsY n=1 Tax=Halotalea alkalilenta TaxID=376489 RepID=UPI000482CF4A|nr:signal recognition particle-docking protein FtsY [Halotalea alkalilenta]
MFGFFKRNKQQDERSSQQSEPSQSPQTAEPKEGEGLPSAEIPPLAEPESVGHDDLAEGEPSPPPADVPDTKQVATAGQPPQRDGAPDGQVSETPASDEPPLIAGREVLAAPPQEALDDEPVESEESRGWFSRIRQGLSKTRSNLTGGIATLFLGEKEIDDELIEDLETQLLMADVGVEATTVIIDRLTERVSRRELSSAQALYRALQEELAAMLLPVERPMPLPPKGQGPFVILVVGVNGVGKTTTIGKLARRFQREGRSVMLAAGDTFRAAAVEQLQVWGERNKVPVIAQHTGADSASVIFDALSAARSRGTDILIADTAGRLHNKSHLMEELKKVRRVMAKLDADAPHEVLLVVDAGTGQNAISQAQTFGDAVPITGIALTKLDGTAKGGVIFALAKQLEIPIRFIGVGETLDDLRPFEAKPFVDALFDQRSS